MTTNKKKTKETKATIDIITAMGEAVGAIDVFNAVMDKRSKFFKIASIVFYSIASVMFILTAAATIVKDECFSSSVLFFGILFACYCIGYIISSLLLSKLCKVADSVVKEKSQKSIELISGNNDKIKEKKKRREKCL